ncbi:hypothetical protein [Arsenophonus sp. ENCA]|uniref:hypothetical protein n=1 Tax=Arsenophonus sp. ENCA TaxID=1987579 RepID=UPI0025B94255|nr:hypothetical protein [Arsenophonus sp. ENCA]
MLFETLENVQSKCWKETRLGICLLLGENVGIIDLLLNNTEFVEYLFPSLAVIILVIYFFFFFFGLTQLKTARNEKKPIALYHFTSKSCLDKIAISRMIKSVSYGVVFSTSNKRKNNRGRNCNPLKRKGVVVFVSESLGCFKSNFRYKLLRLFLLYKVFEINHQEYITKSCGDLYLSKIEMINSHTLLVRKAEIKKCSKRIHPIRILKYFIKQCLNLFYVVFSLCAFLSLPAIFTNILLVKVIIIKVVLFCIFATVILFITSWGLGKIDNIR